MSEINAYADELIKKYDIRSGKGRDTIARSMSGGNQQKAILAREIDRDPELLVAVQPTRGLDVGAIEYIHKELIRQRDEGKAVLLVSLELDEVLNVSDRILVIYEGEIVADLDPEKNHGAGSGTIHGRSEKGGGIMKKKLAWLLNPTTAASFMSSILAIVAGLFVGFIILLVTNPAQAFGGFSTILRGGFTGGAKGIGNIFYLATPIIMTGLSVGFAFKTGLFQYRSFGTAHSRRICRSSYRRAAPTARGDTLGGGFDWIHACRSIVGVLSPVF